MLATTTTLRQGYGSCDSNSEWALGIVTWVPCVVVTEFVPSGATAPVLHQWCEVFSEGQRHLSGTSPTTTALVEMIEAEDDSTDVWRWIARDTGTDEILGIAQARKNSAEADLAEFRMYVTPHAQRRGVGRALAELVEVDIAGFGVRRIRVTALAGSAAEHFLQKFDSHRVLLRLANQVQHLDPSNAEVARAETRPGYRIVSWRNRTPDELVRSFSDALNRLLDAPGADLQIPERNWGVDEVRSWEQKMTGGSQTLLVCCAVDDGVGEVAAATVVTVDFHDSTHASQHDTVVLPQHRGHGLAQWVKEQQASVLAAEFPLLRAIYTTVNAENHPMLTVNRRLGYQTVAERILVEIASHMPR
ncbi:GNAT family N-acetyltransferase [Rhodococcus sp. IEGM 1409]|uniref:GNAT family N-acetyltransferase n=1 Tax=Rhodococcus sp. IEGM 1409 TaxID=3047082 RepID=UPI0024B6BCCF|nr:GNAT family N-acetyltransferase [Rhodococcus sp. IEGM 1409]MDI9902218.1 GNAT family N-acetyltransferase [Rhodococcus sp. IEGM 1409]